MILDSKLLFASQLALSTVGTGLALVGDVIDTSVARELAQGHRLYLVIQVDTTVTSAGAATVQFELVSDSVAAIHTDGTAIFHASTDVIPKATLVAGYQVCEIPLPWQPNNYKQFLGILQNVGTAALTAGKINAMLVTDPYGWKSYASANS